jgi:hypothetical protein
VVVPPTRNKGKSSKKSRPRKGELHSDSKFFAQRSLRQQQYPPKSNKLVDSKKNIDNVICPEQLDEQYRQQLANNPKNHSLQPKAQKNNATSSQAEKAELATALNKPANKN